MGNQLIVTIMGHGKGLINSLSDWIRNLKRGKIDLPCMLCIWSKSARKTLKLWHHIANSYFLLYARGLLANYARRFSSANGVGERCETGREFFVRVLRSSRVDLIM